MLAQTAASKQDAALFAEIYYYQMTAIILLDLDPPQRRQRTWKLSHPKCKCWRGKNRC